MNSVLGNINIYILYIYLKNIFHAVMSFRFSLLIPRFLKIFEFLKMCNILNKNFQHKVIPCVLLLSKVFFVKI